MHTPTHLTAEQIEAGHASSGASPSAVGTLDMVVARPAEDERQMLDEGKLIVGAGLAGDNYLERGSSRTEDGRAHPEAQLNVMNSRIVDLLSAGDRRRWALAGDQLLVDFDLSAANCPPGTRIAIGDEAIIEVSAKPHTGCAKFGQRYGIEAARWVNQEKDERRRGINAMVVQAGTIRPGDAVRKLG